MDNPIKNQEIRSVSGFTALNFKAVGKIILIQGESDSLMIEAEPEFCERIITEVKDNTLVINYLSDWKDWTGIRFLDKGPVIFHLMMKDISSLTLSGVGNLDSAEIKSNALSLNLSGPGSMTIGTLTVEKLSVDLSGVGSIDVAGTCKDHDIKISGAGSYKATRLHSDRITVKLSGVGNATVWAEESLDAKISGAGAVEYYGNAKITQNISGVGVLKYLGNR